MHRQRWIFLFVMLTVDYFTAGLQQQHHERSNIQCSIWHDLSRLNTNRGSAEILTTLESLKDEIEVHCSICPTCCSSTITWLRSSITPAACCARCLWLYHVAPSSMQLNKTCDWLSAGSTSSMQRICYSFANQRRRGGIGWIQNSQKLQNFWSTHMVGKTKERKNKNTIFFPSCFPLQYINFNFNLHHTNEHTLPYRVSSLCSMQSKSKTPCCNGLLSNKLLLRGCLRIISLCWPPMFMRIYFNKIRQNQKKSTRGDFCCHWAPR